MKRHSFLALSGFALVTSAAVFAATQDRLVFRDNKKNPRIQIEGNKGVFEPDKSFELSGNVIVKNLADRFTMTCEKATGNFVKVGGQTEFDNVHLTGGVKADQVGDASSFSASGSKADYDLKDSLRHLNLNGNVTIDFTNNSEVKADPKKPGSKPGQKNSALTVKATDADITFKKTKLKNDKDGLEVQGAIVTGPITFNGTEITKSDGKTTRQKYNVKADKLVYTLNGESGNREVHLTGNLEIHEEDDKGDGPDIVGARSLILQLNSEYEIIRVKFSSEGSGQIKSTFPIKGKGGN